MRTERGTDGLRKVNMITGVNRYAEGSCMIWMGDTQVLCTASAEPKTPSWMSQGSGGWITAEYAMLPRANRQRVPREAKTGRPTGRTQEISRLIGRSLRACTDLSGLEGWTVTVDCDVLQADGGTRCAAVTGGYVALAQALEGLVADGSLPKNPLTAPVAAVSVGLLDGEVLLDLCYAEDCAADVDLNLVMLPEGRIVEVQGTAEGAPFDRGLLDRMLDLGEAGIIRLMALQQNVLAGSGGKTP